MTNNDVLKKLRVALMLRDDEIVEILKLVDFRISKSEIGAFCRKEGHPKYQTCGDQVLRNFLNGLVIHLRGTPDQPRDPAAFFLNKKEHMKTENRQKPLPRQGNVPSKKAKKAPGKSNVKPKK